MKAAEVLRLYEDGRRDFSGESLRGQNFKGKDLSGADFSGADIRSSNFTNANLTKVKFIHAKAGLGYFSSIRLFVFSIFIVMTSCLITLPWLDLDRIVGSVYEKTQFDDYVALFTLASLYWLALKRRKIFIFEGLIIFLICVFFP